MSKISSSLARQGTRNTNRAEIVDHNFIHFLQSWESVPVTNTPDSLIDPESGLDATSLLELLNFQMQSRQVDLVAREMRARNEGFYTIGSSGHENNSVVGYLTRTTDPAFLH
ncbi:MAG: hypothetical protein KJO88_03855, partial [Gammaproteobacteria bacterium]|nr:hypothetical protein [Gammaproteobacteria bacterium]